MNQRTNIFGNGQGLDGDLTTTGATCIASQSRGTFNGRRWLIEGDRTTDCPLCGEAGVIIEGEQRWIQDGRPTAVDGTLVKCGCPLGSNRVVAPLYQAPALRSASANAAVHETSPPAYSSSPVKNTYQPHAFQAPPALHGIEPGFYVVPRCMSYEEILEELGAPHANLPRSLLERLNPTYQHGFKAGEIFVIGDGVNRPVCTQQEMHAMRAAKQAREALTSLTPEEAEFMMEHQAEIAGLLSDVSVAVGMSQAMMNKSLEELSSILRKIEELHRSQFIKHGHLRSNEFFTERRKLFQQLDRNLKMTVLNKQLNLGDYRALRRDLGISARSLVHHWSKAGGPLHIPGYSTHLDKLAKMAKYLKAGGYIGIAIGGAGSATKIAAVCQAGNAEACKKVKVTEAGNFSGGLAGGWAMGKISGSVAAKVCLRAGSGSLACIVVITGAGAVVGSVGGMQIGEEVADLIFEAFPDD